jgi:hypothetical protein
MLFYYFVYIYCAIPYINILGFIKFILFSFLKVNIGLRKVYSILIWMHVIHMYHMISLIFFFFFHVFFSFPFLSFSSFLTFLFLPLTLFSLSTFPTFRFQFGQGLGNSEFHHIPFKKCIFFFF